ncbi:unnamed protein product [Rhizophagus irregularis]|nr:unnamed protein product [Rhizophagus irregularis]
MSTNLVNLWKANSELTVGEITRYRIYFDPRKLGISTAWPPNSLIWNKNVGETWKISLSIPDEEKSGLEIGLLKFLSDIIFTCNRVQYEISLFSVIGDGTLITDEVKIANIKNTYKDDFTLIEIFSPTITYEYFKPKDVFYLPDLTTINNVNREIEDTQDTKDQEVIEEKCKHKLEHEVVVYMSDVNHSVTEDGIEKCGKRLAESILEYIGWPWISSNSTSSSVSKDVAKGPLISQISFIGHSLGAIASPLLGSTDLALFQDQKLEQHSASGVLKEQDPPTVDSFNEEPLLLSLSRPNSSSHIALKLFKNRTLYANTSNDILFSKDFFSFFHKSQ